MILNFSFPFPTSQVARPRRVYQTSISDFRSYQSAPDDLPCKRFSIVLYSSNNPIRPWCCLGRLLEDIGQVAATAVLTVLVGSHEDTGTALKK